MKKAGLVPKTKKKEGADKQYRLGLPDPYVKRLISPKEQVYIPKQMIEQRRESVKLKRIIYEQQRKINSWRDNGSTL